MKKIIIGIVIVLSFVFSKSVYASDLDVTCDQYSGCTYTGDNPLFPSTIIWYPGLSITKTFSVTHHAVGFVPYRMQGVEDSTVGLMDEVMQLSIVRDTDGALVWAGSVDSFYSSGEVLLENISEGSTKTYSITASMPTSAGNEYQGASTVFGLKLGFEGASATSGAGGTSDTCTDEPPGGAPTLLSATSTSPNTVSLTWSSAPNPVSYYLVAYGTNPGNYLFGNPNVGGSSATSYTVRGLSGEETYNFVVRAGNGCAPGPFSNELSVAPEGEVLATPAQGFTPGVLGTATESAQLNTDGVLGSTDSSSLDAPSLLAFIRRWWWVVLSALSLMLIILRLIKRTFR